LVEDLPIRHGEDCSAKGSCFSGQHRHGYATEAVRGLVAAAFALPEVRRVLAETLPELTPSIGVLHKCGFRLIGDGSEPGVIRFEITRGKYAMGYRHGGV
jgi:RimJ/RimL family protein N-acetyltransferase